MAPKHWKLPLPDTSRRQGAQSVAIMHNSIGSMLLDVVVRQHDGLHLLSVLERHGGRAGEVHKPNDHSCRRQLCSSQFSGDGHERPQEHRHTARRPIGRCERAGGERSRRTQSERRRKSLCDIVRVPPGIVCVRLPRPGYPPPTGGATKKSEPLQAAAAWSAPPRPEHANRLAAGRLFCPLHSRSCRPVGGSAGRYPPWLANKFAGRSPLRQARPVGHSPR